MTATDDTDGSWHDHMKSDISWNSAFLFFILQNSHKNTYCLTFDYICKRQNENQVAKGNYED